MKYSEPLVVQSADDVTPRSTCSYQYDCTDNVKFSCLLGWFFTCSDIFSCKSF